MVYRLILLSVCIAAVHCARNPQDIGAAVRCRPRPLVPCDNSRELPFIYNRNSDKCQPLPEGYCQGGIAILWKKGFQTIEECQRVCVMNNQPNSPTTNPTTPTTNPTTPTTPTTNPTTPTTNPTTPTTNPTTPTTNPTTPTTPTTNPTTPTTNPTTPTTPNTNPTTPTTNPTTPTTPTTSPTTPTTNPSTP